MEKVRNVRFVGNFFPNVCGNFVNDDIIIVTSTVDRTQSVCVSFSSPVIYHH